MFEHTHEDEVTESLNTAFELSSKSQSKVVMSNQIKISGKKEQETVTVPSGMKEISSIIRVEDSEQPDVSPFLLNCK